MSLATDLGFLNLLGEFLFLLQEGSEGLVDLFDGSFIRSGDVAIDCYWLFLHLAKVVCDLTDRLSLLLYPLPPQLLTWLAG